LSGEPAAIAKGVDSFTNTDHDLFFVSDTGARNVLAWFDQQGNPRGCWTTLHTIWRAGGKDLFYLGDGNKVVAAEIDTSKGFQAGTPGRMFPALPGERSTVIWDLFAGREALPIRTPAR
jgi:hypothetical protein